MNSTILCNFKVMLKRYDSSYFCLMLQLYKMSPCALYSKRLSYKKLALRTDRAIGQLNSALLSTVIDFNYLFRTTWLIVGIVKTITCLKSSHLFFLKSIGLFHLAQPTGLDVFKIIFSKRLNKW